MRINRMLAQLLLLLLLPLQAAAVPDIQHWKTDNGARVLFIPSDGLPMLDVRIVFDAAGSRDGDLPGLAALTNGLLAEGAAGQDAQQIAERFESVGANFSNDSLRDMAYVGVRTLTLSDYLDRSIATLDDVLSRPDFKRGPFLRELARMRVARAARKQSPSDLASEAFYRALYGDHPYAHPTGGTEQSLDAITREDVQSFYERYYVAGNAVITLVGDISRRQAEDIAQRLVDELPAGERPPPLPPVPEPEEAASVKIDYPSTQSHILVGQTGISRTDDDYYALYVANHILGGSGFSSRLVETIREQRGLAYSVYSYFSPMRKKGPFVMGMQTRADQADEALALLNRELDAYVENGPTGKELEASISNITGSFPLELDSNSKLLGFLAMIGFYDLPYDFLQHYLDRIRAVDVPAIRDALKRRIDPDRSITVIVGNGAG